MSMSRSLLLPALAVASAALSLASPVSSIVVYGDSLSDNGNLFAAVGLPGAPYYMGRRSNGPVAVEQLASNLGAQLVDYAWIGATTGIGNYGDGGTPTSFGLLHLPGMATEFANTASTLTPYLNGLFVVWGGPNDFLAPSPLDTTPQAVIARAVADEVAIVSSLQALGAHDILVPGMPDLGLTPNYESQGAMAAAQATAITDAFNTALQASLPAGATYFDTASLLRTIVANPGQYGFTDVSDPCFNGTSVCSNPGQYLFFDSFHPTTQADALLAQAFAGALATPEPATGVFVGAGFVLFMAGRRRYSCRFPRRALPTRAPELRSSDRG